MRVGKRIEIEATLQGAWAWRITELDERTYRRLLTAQGEADTAMAAWGAAYRVACPE